MMDLFDKDLVIPGLFSALSGLFGWLIGRKKENVEIQGSEITNVQEAIKIWREMATDMKAEVADLKEKVETLTTEIHNLRAENVELRTKLGLTKEEK
jgi:predicted RNase H-like nuclease (RuvC/YqgF family)